MPICALNLKKLWCEYTCGENKVMYVNGTGYKNVSIGNKFREMTEVSFSVDEGTACSIFRSCRKVSMIA